MCRDCDRLIWVCRPSEIVHAEHGSSLCFLLLLGKIQRQSLLERTISQSYSYLSFVCAGIRDSHHTRLRWSNKLPEARHVVSYRSSMVPSSPENAQHNSIKQFNSCSYPISSAHMRTYLKAKVFSMLVRARGFLLLLASTTPALFVFRRY